MENHQELNRICKKDISELKEIAKEGAKRAEKLGIKEKDVPDLVHKSRKR